MSTLHSLEPNHPLIHRGGALSTSLDTILSYIYKYSENHVISGEVSRLYTDIREVFTESHEVSRVQVGLLKYDRLTKAHLFVVWGYLPDQIRIVSCAYYLFRHDDEGAFTRLRCIKPIGV